MFRKSNRRRRAARFFFPSLATVLCVVFLSTVDRAAGQSIIRKLQAPNERIELNANTSQILTLETKFTRVQVNNPSLVVPTVLSPNQVQIAARSPGVTQMNFWDEAGNVYSLDVIIYGDVQELQMAIEQRFPNASVKVYRYTSSLLLTGWVDSARNVSTIQQLAEGYSNNVINNISVGGVQQVMLHVKVMEVSRAKLRRLGFDFTNVNAGDIIASSVAGLVTRPLSITGGVPASTGGENITFGLIGGGNNFQGFVEALRQNNLLKILAEPVLTTVSGRPASFNVGGEFPILIPQSLGTISVQYRPFGTQIDFVPLVLDNGNIRLEVRPRISEIDSTRSVEINDTTVPGLRVREVDTAAEMKAGQTMVIAGLIQTRVEAQNKGYPVLGELPWIGAAFRRVEEQVDEIETIIMVRPEFVAAMDPHEVPRGGPGTDTVSPSDTQLFMRGHIEVPNCCTDNSCPTCQKAGAATSGAVLPQNQALPVDTRGPAGRKSQRPGEHQFRTVGGDGGLQNGSILHDQASRVQPAGLIGPVGYDVPK